MTKRTPPLYARIIFAMITGTLRGLGKRRFWVADSFAFCLYWARPHQRQGTADRHRRADPLLTVPASRKRALASYQEYARTWLDFFWAHTLDLPTARRTTDVVELERLHAARDGGAIFAVAHVGAWDMGATIALAYGVPITTVMRPFSPRVVNDIVIWSRQQKGLDVLMVDAGAARGLLRALHRGQYVALLCDIPEDGPTVRVPFRGGPVEVSAVPARLARTTGRPILPIDCFREGDQYRVKVLPAISVAPIDSDSAVMTAVMASLETSVREHPAQWYPFNPFYADERHYLGEGLPTAPDVAEVVDS